MGDCIQPNALTEGTHMAITGTPDVYYIVEAAIAESSKNIRADVRSCVCEEILNFAPYYTRLLYLRV